MTTTGYKPNLQDPKYRKRIVTRIRQAAGWSKAFLDAEPREVSKRMLDGIFGNTQGNELSVWLRAKLLICTDHKYYFGDDPKCKSYILNTIGLDEIREILQGQTATEAVNLPSIPNTVDNVLYDLELVYFWAQEAHRDELDTLTFSYEEKDSARLWHPLQNLRKVNKEHVWARAGLPHNYDIRACAPTLILQHAKRCGFDEWIYEIEAFVRDPSDLRVHLCNVAGIDAKQAKALLNALFCGAKLGASPEFALFRLLGHDANAVALLRADPRLTELRGAIKACWAAIEPTMGKRVNAETGRKVALNASRKWNLYFDLERAVLNAVSEHLIATDNKHFLEHDGWRAAETINLDELTDHIRQCTGFTVTVVKS